MTPHQHWFIPGMYNLLSTPQKIHFRDNSFVEAPGLGTICFTSKSSGKERKITLTNILHVLTFSLTLISVPHLVESNYSSTFDE
ncbi:hypothetical protein K439DRAFT_1368470 [Ramaria rubella]|nr:hypothetical protein K439DRAFT_1368470 [Ramaria rubella]